MFSGVIFAWRLVVISASIISRAFNLSTSATIDFINKRRYYFVMNNIKAIRERLGLTQAALAQGIGCTQGNVGHYEQGQTVPPEAAKRLIAYAATLGHTITFNNVYGNASEFESPPADAGEPSKADAPLTTDPALAAELVKAEQAGIVKLTKPAKATEPWDGTERRKVVRREVEVANNAELATLRAAGQGG